MALEDVGLPDALKQALLRLCQEKNLKVQFVRLPSPSNATR